MKEHAIQRLEQVGETSHEQPQEVRSAGFLRVVGTDTAAKALADIENSRVRASAFIEVIKQDPAQAAAIAEKMEPGTTAAMFEAVARTLKDEGRAAVADLFIRIEPHHAAASAEHMKPAIAATVLDALVERQVERAGLILQEMEPRAAGRRVEKMNEDNLAAVWSKVDPRDASNIAENMDPVRAARALERAGLETRASMLAHIHETAATTIASKMNPTRVEEVIEEKGAGAIGRMRSPEDATAFEGMKPKRAVEQLEAMKAHNAANLLLHMDEDVALERFVRMDAAHAARVAVAVEPETAARWFEGIVPDNVKKAAAIVETIVKEIDDGPQKAAHILDTMEEREKAATVVAAIRLERAVPVCEQLSESTAGELLTRMPLEKAARVWKAIDVEKAVDVLLYLEERDARGQELATNLLTRANEISAEETAGRLARWKTVIKKNKLFTGLTILLSTAVSGAIDQVQPAIQHRGVDAAVLSLYGSGLGASFLVGNLFFRWATTKELPQWVPFLGGKPLASSANAYQIAFAVGWATVGAATELIVRPYLLGPLTHRGG